MSGMACGGCQCGAVRFRGSKFGRSSICHCRMCQKAFGSPFAILVTVHDLEWTRGAPIYFKSSNTARRGFCAECGTPLTFDYGGAVDIAVCVFDNPDVAAPTIQLNPESKQPFVDGMCSLPTRPEGAEPEAEAFKASIVSFQHPDYDTAEWPRKGAR